MLYQSLKETNSDIAIANFTQFMEERSTFAFHLRDDDYFQEVYSPQERFSKQYEGRYAMSQCFTVSWCKLYKANLFEGVYYPEDEKVEDDYTTWRLYLMADRIVYQNKDIYYHRKRNSSITKTVDDVAVFPLKSIEERVILLSLLGFDISQELRAYRYRLNLHKEAYLANGRMQDYHKILQTLSLLEKWHSK